MDIKTGGKVHVIYTMIGLGIGIFVSFGQQIITWTDNKYIEVCNNMKLFEETVKYKKEYTLYHAKLWFWHLSILSICVFSMYLMVYITADKYLSYISGILTVKWGLILILEFLIGFRFVIFTKTSNIITNFLTKE
jgi:hypothetical protein